MREVKALLHFCETSECLDVCFLYHDGGRPILFEAGDGPLTAELVLATMEPSFVPDSTQMVSGATTLWKRRWDMKDGYPHWSSLARIGLANHLK